MLGSREARVLAFRDLARGHRGVKPTDTVPCDRRSEGGKNGFSETIQRGLLGGGGDVADT